MVCRLERLTVHVLSIFILLSALQTHAQSSGSKATKNCVSRVAGIIDGHVPSSYALVPEQAVQLVLVNKTTAANEALAKSYIASLRLNEAAWVYMEMGDTQKATELIDSIVHSLQTQEILFTVPLGEGITGAQYVEFVNGMASVFKAQIDTGAESWASHSQHEIATYVVDKTIGLNLVPVTIEKTLNGQKGSLQYFVKNAKMGGKKSNHIKLLDYLIDNNDRHDGNFLTRENGSLVAIDHGATFGIWGKHGWLYGMDEIIPSEKVYNALKNTPRSVWEKELRPHLRTAYQTAQNASPQKKSAWQMQSFLKSGDPDAAFEAFMLRIKKFVNYVENEIAENGRAAVFAH